MDRIGQYRIIRRLGAGAMGEVWLGEHDLLRKKRALKVLPRSLVGRADFQKRFVAEARVLALLDHRHIVRVHDMFSEGETYAIAMDFVSPDGDRPQTLEDLLAARGGRLAPDEARRIFLQMCEAVAHAHGHGVLHRDLKPSNVLIDRDGEVRVADFGLAKVVGEEFVRSSIAASISGSLGLGDSRTPGPGAAGRRADEKSLGWDETRADGLEDASSASRSLVGTYNYMPPEVQEGGEWTRRGDVYALGCLAYAMLTGNRPVGLFRLPSELRGDVPSVWDALLRRALAFDPDQRWESVEAMRRQLATVGDAAADAGVPCPPPGGGGGARMGALLVLLVVLAAAAAGYFGLGQSGADRRRAWPGFSDGGSAVSAASDVPAPVAVLPASTPYTEDAGVGLGLEMVWVKGGSFLMGSPAGEEGRFDHEGPQREVVLDGFWLGKHEVTRGQFGRFVDATGYRTDAEKAGKSWGVKSDGSASEHSGLTWRSAGVEQSDFHPVVHVSWTDAVAFCDWLSGVSGRRYVLPSEAEWEYGCRAGSVTAYAWGAGASGGRGWLNGADASFKRVVDVAWAVFPFDDGYVYTSPVGQFRANAWGLHGMHGNAWEWCRDWYAEDFYGSSAARARNPENTTEGSFRVSRGGSWGSAPQLCRSAIRGRIMPGGSSVDLGFRVLAVSATGK